MSRGKARTLGAAALVAVVGAGCWEQVDPWWFSQMKEQPAIQSQEGPNPDLFPISAKLWPLSPPVGTIPLGGLEPRIDHPAPAFAPEAAALVNPIPRSPESTARGEHLFGIYCALCHGPDGMARLDQLPVAQRLAAAGMPPVPLMAVPAYSDGFLFTKIRYGKPGMPGYPQITPEDRWHIVNYLRTLIKGGQS